MISDVGGFEGRKTTTAICTVKHNEAKNLKVIGFTQCELLSLPHPKTESSANVPPHRNSVLPIIQMWGGGSEEWARGGRERERERMYPCTCYHSLHEFRARLSVLSLLFFSGYINIHHLTPHSLIFDTRSKNNSFRKQFEISQPILLHLHLKDSEKFHL